MSCPPSVFWPRASPASPGFRWVGPIFLDLRRQLRRFLFGRFYFRFHRTKGLCNLKWNSIFGGIKYLLSLVQIPFTRTAENIISCHWNVVVFWFIKRPAAELGQCWTIPETSAATIWQSNQAADTEKYGKEGLEFILDYLESGRSQAIWRFEMYFDLEM